LPPLDGELTSLRDGYGKHQVLRARDRAV
jgi:hypothetical protein